jgi:hypothetical protein
MPSRFVVMKSGVLYTYTEYNSIPRNFDHLIEFNPEIPPPPHTDQDHNEIDQWHQRFLELMEIEYASSSKTR